MLHNGLLDLMNRSTCFGHYYAHRQEVATIQMASAYGSSPWLWQVAGLVHGCRFLERPVRGMLHDTCHRRCTVKHSSNLLYLYLINVLVTELRGWTIRGKYCGKGRRLYQHNLQTSWGSPSPPVRWISGYFLAVKRPGRESDHSPPI